jgi:hypothetical protein
LRFGNIHTRGSPEHQIKFIPSFAKMKDRLTLLEELVLESRYRIRQKLVDRDVGRADLGKVRHCCQDGYDFFHDCLRSNLTISLENCYKFLPIMD